MPLTDFSIHGDNNAIIMQWVTAAEGKSVRLYDGLHVDTAARRKLYIHAHTLVSCSPHWRLRSSASPHATYGAK
jgi:hypothetical protein